MARGVTSSLRITRTKTGTRVRATGSAANALFSALCEAHQLDNPLKKGDAKPTPAATSPKGVTP